MAAPINYSSTLHTHLHELSYVHVCITLAPTTTNTKISDTQPLNSTPTDPKTESIMNVSPNSIETEFGIRGEASTNETVQPFITIQETHSATKTELDCTTIEPDFVGGDSVVHLGDRVSQSTVPYEDTTVFVWDLIKNTFVYDNVISLYKYWHAKISIQIVPVFSPFSRGVYRASYGYASRFDGLNEKFFNLHVMTGGNFVDFNVANGEGATIVCDNITPRTMYGNTNSSPSLFFPGAISLRKIILDDALKGSFRTYIHFENLRVAYPQERQVQPKRVTAQMYDYASNPVDKTKTNITPNYSSSSMPNKTDDDLKFDNISKGMPYYIEPVSFSTAGTSVSTNLSDLLTTAMFTDSNMREYFHPLSCLLSCFRGYRCDFDVTLRVIKNSFQAGVLYVRYGADEVGSTADSESISNYNTIAWNIAEQEEITFKVPYSFVYKSIPASLDNRFFRIFTLNDIIPNPSGAGMSVDVYGLVSLSNTAVMYPNNSTLPLTSPILSNSSNKKVTAQSLDYSVGTLSASSVPGFMSDSLKPFLSLFALGTCVENNQDPLTSAQFVNLNLFNIMTKVFCLRSGDITFAAGTAATWIERFAMFDSTLGVTVPATIAQVDWPISQPGWIVSRAATGALPNSDNNNLYPIPSYANGIVYSYRKCSFGFPILPLVVNPSP